MTKLTKGTNWGLGDEGRGNQPYNKESPAQGRWSKSTIALMQGRLESRPTLLVPYKYNIAMNLKHLYIP